MFANGKNLILLNRYPGRGIPSVSFVHKACGYLAARMVTDLTIVAVPESAVLKPRLFEREGVRVL